MRMSKKCGYFDIFTKFFKTSKRRTGKSKRRTGKSKQKGGQAPVGYSQLSQPSESIMKWATTAGGGKPKKSILKIIRNSFGILKKSRKSRKSNKSRKSRKSRK